MRSFESRIDHVYDYTDEDGDVLFQAVRLRDPKDFRQRRPVDGGWEWNLTDIRRVPYRLPELLAASTDRRAVWFAEGEKDADALAALGFVATCNPMGAGSWSDEYADHFKGCAAVLVVADCDQPGRKHAQQVCASLHKAGVPCRLIDLARERDDHYDVSDYLLEHGEKARAMLEDLARETRPWPAGSPVRLPITPWREFVDSVGDYDETRDYLGALLRGGQRAHIIGPIGHGKTTFMAEIVASAVTGREFLGFQGRGNIRGLYIDLEMPPELLKETLEAARFDVASDLFDVVNIPDGLEVDRNEKHREMIENAMGSYQVVAIDPWYKLIGEELSDGMRNARTVISFLDGLRERYDRTALVVGFHANEPQRGQRIKGLGDASGYKIFQRPADTAIMFERVRGDRSRVTWAKTRSSRLPKMGEEWLVEWTRGAGFQRIERTRAVDELYELLTDDWQDVQDIAEQFGRSRARTSLLLNDLEAERRAEWCQVGKRKQWRRAQVDQLAIEEAA